MAGEGKALPEDYFEVGVFRNALPGELLATHTCHDCHVRFKTFAAFRQHRRELQGGCKDISGRPAWLTDQQAA